MSWDFAYNFVTISVVRFLIRLFIGVELHLNIQAWNAIHHGLCAGVCCASFLKEAEVDIVKTDVAIVGAGGGGLRAAIAIAEANPSLEIALIS